MSVICDSSYKFKIVIVGNSGVGKTTLTVRYSDGKYMDNSTVTIGVDLKMKQLEIDDKSVTLMMWDTAGTEKRGLCLSKQYYNNAQGVIFVYDVTDQSSFNDLPIWINDCNEKCDTDVIRILVGTKSDKSAVVSRTDAQHFAFANDMALFETSSKSDSEKEIIDSIFTLLARKMIAKHAHNINLNRIQLDEATNSSQRRSCCG